MSRALAHRVQREGPFESEKTKIGLMLVMQAIKYTRG